MVEVTGTEDIVPEDTGVSVEIDDAAADDTGFNVVGRVVDRVVGPLTVLN